MFVDRRGTPRQGSLAPAASGWLEMARHVPRASLEGLEEWSHVWVIFVFDRNTNAHKAVADRSKVRRHVTATSLPRHGTRD